LFLALHLADWNGLSNSQLEEALTFRVDYKRFVGLDLDAPAPDATTFVVFRRRIQPIREKLLEILNRQLEDKGYKVHSAVAVCVSLMEARSKPHRKSDDDDPKTGDTDGSWRGFPTKKTKNTEGEEVVSRRPALFGSKIHASASGGTGFIIEIIVTTAIEHEVAHGEDLLREETEIAFMDNGYTGLQDVFNERRVRDRNQKNARRNHPLTVRGIIWNKRITKSRRIVETVFGCWKLWYRWHKTRYMGWNWIGMSWWRRSRRSLGTSNVSIDWRRQPRPKSYRGRITDGCWKEMKK
jgi:transposase, IS5 family